MSNDIKYNIKINVDGKDYVVETTQNVKDLANGIARVQKEAEEARKAMQVWTNLALSTQALMNSLQNLTGVMSELVNRG